MERRCCIRLLLILGGILAAPAAHADDARVPATRAELLDPVWIEDALAELGIDRLIKEYDGHADPLVQRVRDALVLSRWFLREHPEELRSQLQARLISSTEPELQVFQELPADRVRARATRASLNQAGDGLVGTYRLSGQGGEFVVSADGSLVAMQAHRHDRGNRRNTAGIELRNSLNGDLIAYIAESDEGRYPIALSPNRQTLIVMQQQITLDQMSGVALAWDVSSNRMLWQAKVFDAPFSSGRHPGSSVLATISPDGSKLAIVTFGSNAIYDAATGDVLVTLDIADDAVITDLAFLNEEQLAGCASGMGLRIWDTATGAVATEHEFWAARLSDDGRMALVVDEKPGEPRDVLHRMRIHDTMTGDLIREIAIDEVIMIRDHEFRPPNYDFDPEGAHVFVAASGMNAPIVAFSVESGEVAARVPQGNSVSYYMRPLAGLRALTSSFDDLIHVWDLNRTGERRVADQPGRIRLVDITADGRFGVTDARAEGEVHLMDLETGATIGVFQLNPPSQYMGSLCISDDAGVILAQYDETVFRVDPALGTVETLLESPLGKGQTIWRIRMSGDGSAAVAVGREATLVFDPSTGEALMTTKGGRDGDISQDGNVVLAGQRIVNRNTGDETVFATFEDLNVELCDDGSRAIDFTPWDGYSVWNIATASPLDRVGGELKSEFIDPNKCGCDLSDNGRFVICSDENGQLAVYDTQDRKLLATLGVDDTGVAACVISADGSSVFLTTHMGRLHHYRLENLPGSTGTE